MQFDLFGKQITFISDTHGKHEELDLPGGDILVHGGDVEARGSVGAQYFVNWLKRQDYTHKVFIAGNHDFYFQDHPPQHIERLLEPHPDITYLQDEGAIIEGIKFWGTPWSLPFFDWAFMAPEEELRKKYDQIPQETDILISHGPPKGILDTQQHGISCGSMELGLAISRVDPDIVVFGHIHEARGMEDENGTIYLNASVLDEDYVLTNRGYHVTY